MRFQGKPLYINLCYRSKPRLDNTGWLGDTGLSSHHLKADTEKDQVWGQPGRATKFDPVASGKKKKAKEKSQFVQCNTLKKLRKQKRTGPLCEAVISSSPSILYSLTAQAAGDNLNRDQWPSPWNLARLGASKLPPVGNIFLPLRAQHVGMVMSATVFT